MMHRIGIAVFVASAATVSFVGCHAIQEKLSPSPTEPTEAKPSPAPLSIPIILPKSPTPAPTPTPATPAPTPTPTPAAPPPTGGGSCTLPPSNNPTAPCSAGSQSFLAQVDAAITYVTQQQPALFDFDDKKCGNCYRIKNEAKFVDAVEIRLGQQGLCTYYDGEELAVKNTNSFNDQYDIVLSSGHIRRGAGSYRVTCRPSWF
jgi:hypothetical protein